MKCDISRNKNSVRVKIKDFETFNIERKTKKDTLPCPWEKIWIWFEKWWMQNIANQKFYG